MLLIYRIVTVLDFKKRHHFYEGIFGLSGTVITATKNEDQGVFEKRHHFYEGDFWIGNGGRA
jgi:hypothetical protein